ncbi:hypothetical protein QNH09_gp30 [Aeromonas phage PVN03]|uniref:Uncharacterized protein n=1 Tax=Aeromonas phage PVN03 TaxID=2822864 RepID=A0AAE7UV09_9CAUD|nr:hypothetical protein QNH09_gp30 [Aeromonas phage PVN03]QTQ06812.1 hypothetical protein [Aeromonas phage PVN03]QTQ06943.1 hypothetical protein [Aeromonas phage PVN05]
MCKHCGNDHFDSMYGVYNVRMTWWQTLLGLFIGMIIIPLLVIAYVN